MSNLNIPDSLTRETNLQIYKILIIVGGLLVGIGVFIAATYIPLFAVGEFGKKEMAEGAAAVIVYAGAGMALIIPISIQKNKRAKFRKYVNLILHQQITDLDMIANIMQKKYRIVDKDVQTLIGSRYFEGAYIDKRSRVIVFPYGVPQMVAGEHRETVVICNNCAATNKVIVGQTKICEYCGSAIIVEDPLTVTSETANTNENTQQPNIESITNKNSEKIGFIFGLISVMMTPIVIADLTILWIVWIVAIIGLVYSHHGKRSEERKFAIAGIALSIFSIILALVFSFIAAG